MWLEGHPAIFRLSYFPHYPLDHKRQLPPEAYDQERFRLAKALANVVRCAPGRSDTPQPGSGRRTYPAPVAGRFKLLSL